MDGQERSLWRRILAGLVLSALFLWAFVPAYEAAGGEFVVVVNWALITTLAMVLAWLTNSGLGFVGVDFGEKGKKAVAFAFSVAAAAFFAIQALPFVPAPAVDPFGFAYAILGIATGTFKAAQEIYDHVWPKITGGVMKLFGR
jgi:hypothetical protein